MKPLPKITLFLLAVAVCALGVWGVLRTTRHATAPARKPAATSSAPIAGSSQTRSPGDSAKKERAKNSSSRQPRVVELRGFRYAEYFDAPQETRVKTRLEGAKAQPQPGGLVAVSGARLETFLENGQPELVMEAPECTHNASARTISSPGPLRVKMADGSFSIQGEGFLYQQTNSILMISNRVETVAQPELLQERQGGPGEQAPPGAPMEINSDKFQYAADQGVGVYKGNVRVTGTNLAVACGLLTLKLPVEERRLRSITAEQEVKMDYAGMNANGQRAVYDVDTGVAEVTGSPTWSTEGREGRADKFTIDRTNRLVLAQGDAWLRMPGQSLAANLLPSFDTPVKENSTGPQSVEVRSGSYELRTNTAVFNREVVVTEMTGQETAGQLKCAHLTVTFQGTNELERLVAQDGVEIARGDSRLRAHDAVYTATNNLLKLEGDPSWQAGLREGKGRHISVDTARNEMQVRGDASMRMPAEALQGALAPSNPDLDLTAAEGRFAEVQSEEYFVKAEQALFRGGVHVTHPQSAMNCEELIVSMPPQAEHVAKIVADRQVTFNAVNPGGERVRGSGDTAVYSYEVNGNRTNEQLSLSGNAVLQTTNGSFRNPIIVYDHAQNKWMARGPYVIRGLVPEGRTNLFKMPK